MTTVAELSRQTNTKAACAAFNIPRATYYRQTAKYRKKAIFEDLRKYLGEIFRDLATQKECKVAEGHLMPNHVHILISIPPKHSVSQVVGFIKGKSAI